MEIRRRSTSSNIMQHRATRWPNECNMLDLMLDDVASVRPGLKGALHLNAIFPLLDMALMKISRSRFKKAKNPIIIS